MPAIPDRIQLLSGIRSYVRFNGMPGAGRPAVAARGPGVRRGSRRGPWSGRPHTGMPAISAGPACSPSRPWWHACRRAARRRPGGRQERALTGGARPASDDRFTPGGQAGHLAAGCAWRRGVGGRRGPRVRSARWPVRGPCGLGFRRALPCPAPGGVRSRPVPPGAAAWKARDGSFTRWVFCTVAAPVVVFQGRVLCSRRRRRRRRCRCSSRPRRRIGFVRTRAGVRCRMDGAWCVGGCSWRACFGVSAVVGGVFDA